jgi:hypothetical protein
LGLSKIVTVVELCDTVPLPPRAHTIIIIIIIIITSATIRDIDHLLLLTEDLNYI